MEFTVVQSGTGRHLSGDQKSMYGKSYMGIDRSTYLIGKDGKVAQVWRKVKVKEHAAEVLAAAKAFA